MNEQEIVKAWLASGSIISSSSGQLLIGWGKVKKIASVDQFDAKTAFYFPDFFLRDPFPWFIYEHTLEIDEAHLLQLLSKIVAEQDNCFIWVNNGYPLFCRTFDVLMEQMKANKIEKAVPYIFESSLNAMTRQQMSYSLYRALTFMQHYPGYLYGFWDDHEGMLGVTPEVLFQFQGGRRIHTMACAGTNSKKEGSESLLSDPKESHEHSLVVQGIRESLQPLGCVREGEKKVLPLSTINHLVTPITVDLHSSFHFAHTVHMLHPTPALGAFPRDEGKRWLESYQQLVDRRRFGAPAGYVKRDSTAACYVAIRNVQWDPVSMRIGAGCGVIASSQLNKEWREINLKLQTIKEMLEL